MKIYGNHNLIRTLETMTERDRTAHTVLFYGENGTGKKTIAEYYIHLLMCNDKKDGKPCFNCKACHNISDNIHPDVITAEKSGKLGGYSVETVKKICSDVFIRPNNSDKKVYIFKDCNNMDERSQNTLLKIIEEPPEYAVFFLLAENIYAFLPTIMSRCVLFNIKPVPAFKIKNYLLERKLADEQADMVAEYAQGSIGKAIRFAESEEFSAMRQKVIETLSGIKNAPYYVLTEAAKELAANNDAADITDMIYLWQRDVLAYKITEDKNCIIEKDMTDRIVDEARNNSYEALCGVPEFIMKTKKYLKQNVNSQFALEMLFINIKGELVNDRSSRS